MKALLILLLIPVSSYATEFQLACNLEKSKAEVSATTLAAPNAFGQIGQDPSTGSRSMNIGVSQSFSGRSQASYIRQAAEAKCDSLQASLMLDENGRWAQNEIKRDAAKIELQRVEEAIKMARLNIVVLDEQLSQKIITITQHNDARNVLVNLESKQADLLRLISVVVLPPPVTNVSVLLEQYRLAESSAAQLTAQASAEKGWDVVIAAGARQPLSNGGATPFATVSFKWSFGSSAANAAARDVGTQTSALLVEQQGGYAQTVLRQRKEIQSLIDTERADANTSAKEIENLKRIRATMDGIDSVLAINTIRALDLQLLILQADKEGSESRLNGYKILLDKLQ